MATGSMSDKKAAAWVAMGVAVALLVVPEIVAAQCAMCRTALLNSPEGQQLASSFNRGILFLLAAPFVVLGAVAFLLWKARRDHALLAGRPASRPSAALLLPSLIPEKKSEG